MVGSYKPLGLGSQPCGGSEWDSGKGAATDTYQNENQRKDLRLIQNNR